MAGSFSVTPSRFHHNEQHGVKTIILSDEFVYDLGISLSWGRHTITCLWPETDVLQLKIHCTEVQSCGVSSNKKVIFYTWLEMRTNVTLGLLWTQQMADSIKGHAMRETHNFDRIYIYSPDRYRQCQAALHTLCRSTAFSSVKESTSYSAQASPCPLRLNPSLPIKLCLTLWPWRWTFTV